MIDINKMLSDIIEKHQIKLFTSELYTSFFKNISLSLIQADLTGKRIAVRCCGQYMHELISNFSEYINIVAIYDKQPQHLSLSCGEFDVQTPDAMDRADFDIVLIATVEYEDSIVKECIEKDFPYWSVRIALKKYDVVFPMAGCYLYSLDLLTGAELVPLYAIMLQIIGKHLPDFKEKAMTVLISYLIYMKDICFLKQILVGLCEERFSSNINYPLLLDDLINLELSIKDILNERIQNDYICFWMDALNVDFIQNATYLSKTKEKSYCFTRAYTTTPSTLSVMRSIFYKLWDIDDDDVKINQDSNAYTLFTKYNISSYYYGHKYKLFDNLKRLDEPTFRHGKKLRGRYYSEMKITECFWSSLENLLVSSSTLFIVMHTFREAHAPYIAPNICNWEYVATMGHLDHEIEPPKIYEQRIKALEYYDREIEWFCSLMPKNQTRLFFSDHGTQIDSNSCLWSEELTHVNLFIDSPSLKAYQENRLFSFINFFELFNWLIRPDALDNSNLFSDIVCIQSRDYYAQIFVEQIVEHGCQKNYMAYRGAIGKSDKFIRLGNGQEMYFLLPDEQTNYIHEPLYQSRIQKLREIAGNYFIDIYQNEKYQYSRLLYQ